MNRRKSSWIVFAVIVIALASFSVSRASAPDIEEQYEVQSVFDDTEIADGYVIIEGDVVNEGEMYISITSDGEKTISQFSNVAVPDPDDSDLETLGACSTLLECAALCSVQGESRGGATSASLVDDLTSIATGKACDCKFGNGGTSHNICVSPVSPRKR